MTSALLNKTSVLTLDVKEFFLTKANEAKKDSLSISHYSHSLIKKFTTFKSSFFTTCPLTFSKISYMSKKDVLGLLFGVKGHNDLQFHNIKP